MKLRIVKRFLPFILFVLVTAISYGQAQPKPGVFYAVTGKGSKDTSWLFGTYHLINGSYLNETPAVMRAFTKAKNTVVEIIIDSTELATANTKALLQNKRLSELFSKEFSDSLDRELKTSIGQGIAQFDAVKPMTVILTLSMVNLMRDNRDLLTRYTGVPLDVYFVNKQKEAGKTVTALETLTQQMDMLFNTLSDEAQADMVQQFIRNKEQAINLGNELVKNYFENDLDKMYAVYKRSVQAGGDMDFLVTNRNNNWMKVLPSMINQQSNFIAVGALHLAGPGGLVAQLQKAGYTVTPQTIK
ncbi:MAG: TraB/GumN family protein [Sphingobacteriales bacterium]|nr:MAG: TraB/GumN family protein [Sphingobacteriales bacterium]